MSCGPLAYSAFNLEIAEIANKVGYENQSKFATAFRDVFKIAPAEYRKQNSGD